MTSAVTIDVVSDVMCPWCYIGKRRLEAALTVAAEHNVEVRWRPFQLDATLPRRGKDRRLYLEEKFGGAERAKEIYSRIEEAGKQEDIPFAFDAISVSPNTLDAHRLIRWAGGISQDVQDKVVEALFRTFFVEGGNIGDHEVLVATAHEAGMNPHIVRDMLDTEKDLQETQAEVAQASAMGVQGVPCFILNGRHAVSGAQSAENLASAIRQVSQMAATATSSTG
ncbi:MAG: DsbA family oxidoreductase [Pseudomonadota bacterium]